jgi:phosphoglycerate dehydrogenase-like enzyme
VNSHSPKVRVLSQFGADINERVRADVPEATVMTLQDWDRDRIDVVLADQRSPELDDLASHTGWIHALGTGVECIPQEILRSHLVTCSRGASAVPIAEFVLATMLADVKQMPDVWRPARQAHWGAADLGTLNGKSLAVLGYGSIGRLVAHFANAFRMDVTAFTTSARSESEVRTTTSLLESTAFADHVVVCLPLTPATERLLSYEAFESMRAGAHLINVARGGIVDQDALRERLRTDAAFRASLDVCDPEPLPADHWLATHPRVRISPHVSWASPVGPAIVLAHFVENLRRFAGGEELHGKVDPDKHY